MPMDELLAALNQHPWLLGTALLGLGLVVGSFLNVVIHRLPLMMEREELDYCNTLLDTGAAQGETLNLVRPGSRCPHCGCAIRPWQNVPVLSYLLLRGRCHHCKTAISPRYPAVEMLSGLLALALAWHYGSVSAALLGALLFTWALVALAAIDIEHTLLPDSITLSLLWLGLLFNLNGTFVPLTEAVTGAVAGYLSLWSMYWLFKWATGQEGMGYGDFKLLAALGAWTGWKLLPLILLMSSLTGMVLGTLALFLQNQDRSSPIPYGPFLALAGWVTLLWGEGMVEWYLGWVRPAF